MPNVNQDGFWEADLDAATVNGVDTGLKGRTTILDTGTTLLLVSDDVVDAIYGLLKALTSAWKLSDVISVLTGAIPGAKFDDRQGGYLFPSDADIPDISFAVGDTLYKVTVVLLLYPYECTQDVHFYRSTLRTSLSGTRAMVSYSVESRVAVTWTSTSLAIASSSPFTSFVSGS